MSFVVYSGYCNSSIAPGLANAVSQTPSTSLGLTTYFSCEIGYSSTSSTSPPFYSCLLNTALEGSWSSVTNACNRMEIQLFVLKIYYYEFIGLLTYIYIHCNYFIFFKTKLNIYLKTIWSRIRNLCRYYLLRFYT